MNSLIIFSTILGIIIFTSALYLQKWKPKHIISITLSLLAISIFTTYGQQIIQSIWKTANASDTWIISFLLIYLGGALIAFTPFLTDGLQKKDLHRFKVILKIWITFGILYMTLNNTLSGPYAVGPDSPYNPQNLCTLPPTALASDVFIGCQLHRIGINPYTELASNITYYWFSITAILLSILIIGSKKIEHQLFENGW